MRRGYNIDPRDPSKRQDTYSMVQRSIQETGLETSCLQHRSGIHLRERAEHKHTYKTTQENSEYPGLSLNGAPGP